MKFQQGAQFVIHLVFITKQNLLGSNLGAAAAEVWIPQQEEPSLARTGGEER